MKEEPKVLTRMRLSCCWGDNLNEKELNEVVDYINNLQSQLKAKEEVIKEAIDKLNHPWSFESGNKRVDEITYQKKREVIEILSKGENK
jgi:hypothetical protein